MQPMEVVFRIAGLDGEATEERIESLPDGNEPTSEAEIEKKYCLAKVLSQKLGQSTGIETILNILGQVEQI